MVHIEKNSVSHKNKIHLTLPNFIIQDSPRCNATITIYICKTSNRTFYSNDKARNKLKPLSLYEFQHTNCTFTIVPLINRIFPITKKKRLTETSTQKASIAKTKKSTGKIANVTQGKWKKKNLFQGFDTNFIQFFFIFFVRGVGVMT